MPATAETFRSRLREVWDVLAYTFDFDIFERPQAAVEYASPAPWLPAFVVPGATVSVVGRDGTGGVYISCERGGQSCVLHVDTRGNAVCLGEELLQAVALVVALPYWPELLAQYSELLARHSELLARHSELLARHSELLARHSELLARRSEPLARYSEPLAPCPSGDLSALRALAERLEREACDEFPALPSARQDLQSFLELPELADPIARLHQLAVERPPPVTVWSPHGWRYESPVQGAAPGLGLA